MLIEHDPFAPVLIWVTFILSLALIGRFMAIRLGQSGVLGELLIGVLLGNLGYFLHLELITVLREGSTIFNVVQEMLQGAPLNQAVQLHAINSENASQILTILEGKEGLTWIKIVDALDVFSRYGVIFLLFIIGLESSVTELKKTGQEAIRVAFLGVFAPVLFGFLVVAVLMPDIPFKTNLFVAAALSATSVGITARVLREMNQLQTREGKTILGAAVIDDILGLIVLALVSALIVKGKLDSLLILRIVFSASLFFVGVLWCGPWILRRMIRFFNHFLDFWEVKLFTSFIFLTLLSWLATVVDLAAIIGAFAAGLILHDDFFGEGNDLVINQRKDHHLAPESTSKASSNKEFVREGIKKLIGPFEAILAPLFFILMGIQVKLEFLMDWSVIGIALGLTVAAILGKLVAGLGGSRQDDRWLIGMGMLPRGEVGLIFASIGKTLGVLPDQLFASIILMVIITTFITPIALKKRYSNQARIKQV